MRSDFLQKVAACCFVVFALAAAGPVCGWTAEAAVNSKEESVIANDQNDSFVYVFNSISELQEEDVESAKEDVIAQAETTNVQDVENVVSEEAKDVVVSNEDGETEAKIADPFGLVNEAVFTFNDSLYDWVLKPAAKGYIYVTPEVVRTGVSNIFSNLTTPINMVNNLLQGNPKGFSSEFLRLFLNSTFGIAGIFDIATMMGVPKDEATFDQTLGMYGVPEGFPFVMPFFGNRSIRGVVGLVGDMAMSPSTYLGFYVFALQDSVVYKAIETIDYTALNYGDYDSTKAGMLDPYTAIVIDALPKYRKKQIEKARKRSMFFN
jgi:phospholipid-binding lipoprotein MlaA